MNLGTATTLADGNLTYHTTMICEALPDGKTRLNSGGWRTRTTKKKMNQYAEMMGRPWRVYQRNHEWIVEYSEDTYYHRHHRVIRAGDGVKYADNMEV